MFYIFIVLLTIATIVLYRLQKNLQKTPSSKGRHEEQTALPHGGEGHQMDSQDEPPIPPTTTSQTLPFPKQQAEISTVQHPISHITKAHQGETPPDSESVPEDSSGTPPHAETLAPRKINTYQGKRSQHITFKDIVLFVKEIVSTTILVTAVMFAIIAVLFLLLWFIEANWTGSSPSGFPEANWADILKVIMWVSLTVGFYVVLSFIPAAAWLKSQQAGARVSLLTWLSMRIRRVNVKVISNAWMMAVNAGLKLTIHDLEAHHIAGGDVERVVAALIAAKNTNMQLSFEQAATLDLAGDEELGAFRNQTETSEE